MVTGMGNTFGFSCIHYCSVCVCVCMYMCVFSHVAKGGKSLHN